MRREGHRYLKDLEEREDAGTPQIVGAIRAGLVFQLKADVTPQVIMHRDRELVKLATPTSIRHAPAIYLFEDLTLSNFNNSIIINYLIINHNIHIYTFIQLMLIYIFCFSLSIMCTIITVIIYLSEM